MIQSNFRVVAIEIGDPENHTFEVSIYDGADGKDEELVYVRHLNVDALIVRSLVGNEDGKLLEAIKGVLRTLDGKDWNGIL